jgi:hypothetical protein
LFFCVAKRKVPKRKGDPAFAPPAAVPKISHSAAGKKELAFFGPEGPNGARTTFLLYPLQSGKFLRKRRAGEREPGPRAAARPVLVFCFWCALGLTFVKDFVARLPYI